MKFLRAFVYFLKTNCREPQYREMFQEWIDEYRTTITPSKLGGGKVNEVVFLNAEQVDLLINYWYQKYLDNMNNFRAFRNAAMIILGTHARARIGDLRNLKTENILLKGKTRIIVFFKDGKGGKSEKTPLLGYHDILREYVLLVRKMGREYLFPTSARPYVDGASSFRKDAVIGRKAYENAVKEGCLYLREMGLLDFEADTVATQNMRRTANDSIAKKKRGLDLDARRVFMRHEKLETILKHYEKPTDAEDIADLIEDILEQENKRKE